MDDLYTIFHIQESDSIEVGRKIKEKIISSKNKGEEIDKLVTFLYEKVTNKNVINNLFIALDHTDNNDIEMAFVNYLASPCYKYQISKFLKNSLDVDTSSLCVKILFAMFPKNKIVIFNDLIKVSDGEINLTDAIKLAEDNKEYSYSRHLRNFYNSQQYLEKPIYVNSMPEDSLHLLGKQNFKQEQYPPDILESIQIFYKSLMKKDGEKALFRCWGPVNKIKERNCCVDNEPCRMFSCLCHQNDPEDEEISEWFVGFCLLCKKKIKDLTHSVRLPVEEGGWRGCFCSYECVEKNYEFISEIEKENIKTVKDMLQQIGIMDRSLL